MFSDYKTTIFQYRHSVSKLLRPLSVTSCVHDHQRALHQIDLITHAQLISGKPPLEIPKCKQDR